MNVSLMVRLNVVPLSVSGIFSALYWAVVVLAVASPSATDSAVFSFIGCSFWNVSEYLTIKLRFSFVLTIVE